MLDNDQNMFNFVSKTHFANTNSHQGKKSSLASQISQSLKKIPIRLT